MKHLLTTLFIIFCLHGQSQVINLETLTKLVELSHDTAKLHQSIWDLGLLRVRLKKDDARMYKNPEAKGSDIFDESLIIYYEDSAVTWIEYRVQSKDQEKKLIQEVRNEASFRPEPMEPFDGSRYERYNSLRHQVLFRWKENAATFSIAIRLLLYDEEEDEEE